MSNHTKVRTLFLSTLSLLGLAQPALAATTTKPTTKPASAKAATLPSNMELNVNLTIAQPSGGRYQRPYVAVWIEDAKGNEVRTLSVWADTSPRGARYLEHLQRWFGFAQSESLLPTVSSATRNPGTYNLSWDGKTDKGVQAAQGSYILCIEIAREHGPYGVVRTPLTLGSTPVKKALDVSGASDLSSASAEYRKK